MEQPLESTWRFNVTTFTGNGPSAAWHYSTRNKLKIEKDGYKNLRRVAESIRKDWKRICQTLRLTRSLEWRDNGPLSWILHDGADVDSYRPAAEAQVVLNRLMLSESIKVGESLATQVGQHMTVQIRGAGHSSSSWFYRDNADRPFWHEYLDSYLLSFRELREDPAKYVERLESHRILFKYSVEEYRRNDQAISVRLRIVAKLVPYVRGIWSCCVPIPGKDPWPEKDRPGEPDSVASPEIVVSSPRIVEALRRLSDVWQDRFARSVLISAPTGSGKEALSQSVAFGSGRDTSRIQQLSLATGDISELERRLFGFKRDDGSIEPGLIAKASQSTLFLDEAHRPENEEGVRASLLRPLEAKEYFPSGCDEVQRVRDILFVFAVSSTFRELAKVPPKDFWTRMQYAIRLSHPLKIAGAKKRGEVLQDFFRHFWWEMVESYFDQPLSLYEVSDGKEEYDSSKKAVRQPLVRELTHKSSVDDASKEFVAALRNTDLLSISIRALKSIVGRLFSQTVENALAGIPVADFLKENARTELTKARRDVRAIGNLRDARSPRRKRIRRWRTRG